MLLEMQVRRLVQGSTLFIAAGQLETSQQQPMAETRSVRPLELKMEDYKPEVEIILEQKEPAKRFQRLNLHFRPCPTQI